LSISWLEIGVTLATWDSHAPVSARAFSSCKTTSSPRSEDRFAKADTNHDGTFGRLWYGEPNAVSNAIRYAKFYSRSHDAVVRVYDEAGNVIETHEHAGEFKAW
jgi:hypothetical protein